MWRTGVFNLCHARAGWGNAEWLMTDNKKPAKQKPAGLKFSTSLNTSLVPGVGLEPTHLAAGDFESPASTDFATRARVRYRTRIM